MSRASTCPRSSSGPVPATTDLELRAVVQDKLEIEWSLEQMAAYLRLEFPNRPGWHLCHETIYQALYRGSRGGLNRQLTERLRTRRPLRKHRRDRTSVAPIRRAHTSASSTDRRS